MNLRIVLVAPRNPLNIGAAARAMSNFGFTDMALVNPYDVAFQQARSAVRAHYILERAQVFTSDAEAIAGCGLVIGTTAGGKRDLHVPLYPLEAAPSLIAERSAATVALLFGSEKFGLSNESMSHCHALVRIPTRDEHASMNLGQAVAICLYEIRRSEERAATRFPERANISATDAGRLTEILSEILSHSGYIHDRTAASSVLKLRRLILRLGMPAGDIETWLGILRQILWKVKR